MRTASGGSIARAAVDTVIEHALEQARPAHARGGRGRMIGAGLRVMICGRGYDPGTQLGRIDSTVGQARRGTESGASVDAVPGRLDGEEGPCLPSRLHELRRQDHDVSRALLVRTLQAQYDITGAVATESAVGDRRPGDVTAQLFQFFALLGCHARSACGRRSPHG